MAHECDLCDQELDRVPEPEYSINICDSCAEVILRNSLPDVDASDARFKSMLETVRRSLAQNLESFVNDGTRFEVAPDATPEEKRLAARDVLRSIIFPDRGEKTQSNPKT